MTLFANYRADRLIAEVKSSGNPGSPLAQKALEKLVALGPSAIEPIIDALTTAEGHFVTPTIIGRRLTLNPLLVFLALAFWTWMWGPVGAFLAAPLSIIGLVIFNHLFPANDVRLPE